ncbi:von Willebrand factor type A domain protein [Ancylostoma caninum]|uniref:von Willebrand factor type A domain protein n=1 Tax=Ancylostoma caninum TaxID=29170 RepID=A0A368FJG6_ANCCA|nr:von Willebrand factor type A domain protein [Ancylostoma caninum]
MLDFFRKDFHVSIIGIDVDKTVYSGVEHHKFFSLPSSDMRKVSENFLTMVENEAIAPWCRRYVSNSPTTPRPTTRKTTPLTAAKTLISTTTTPYLKATTATPPVDIMPKDFLNCSCTEQNLWLDIVFIIDVSASMSHESLVEIFANMITVVTDFTFDRSEDRHVRIGIVAVADGVSFSEYNITKYSEFEAALEKIEPTDEKHINLFRGFIESQRVFGHIDRKNAPDVIVIYSSSFEKGGMNDPTSIADQLKISGTQIITMAFVGTGQSKVVLGLGSIASPRMNFTTWQHRDLTGKILDGFCQGEPSTALRNHHIS